MMQLILASQSYSQLFHRHTLVAVNQLKPRESLLKKDFQKYIENENNKKKSSNTSKTNGNVGTREDSKETSRRRRTFEDHQEQQDKGHNEDLSIKEANELRAKLGLKPLRA